MCHHCLAVVLPSSLILVNKLTVVVWILNVPDGFMCLNIWPSGGGTIWESCEIFLEVVSSYCPLSATSGFCPHVFYAMKTASTQTVNQAKPFFP